MATLHSGTMSTPAPDSWDRLLPAHQAAVADFVAAARALPDLQWDSPLASGHWCPGQVAEHLRLTYELMLGELRGQRGLRLRTPIWLRPWLRLRYLRPTLKDGVFPPTARAPSELRPGPGPFPKSGLLEDLQDAAGRFEAELRVRWTGRVRLTHHVFGGLSGTQALQLLTAHTRHHRAQLPAPRPRLT